MISGDQDEDKTAHPSNSRYKPVAVQPLDILSGKGKQLYNHRKYFFLIEYSFITGTDLTTTTTTTLFYCFS